MVNRATESIAGGVLSAAQRVSKGTHEDAETEKTNPLPLRG